MSATALYDILPVRVPTGGRAVNHFAVFAEDGTRVSGFYRTLREATDQRIALIRARTEKARPAIRDCMCCGHAFTSTGIHNRLCGICTTGTPRSDW